MMSAKTFSAAFVGVLLFSFSSCNNSQQTASARSSDSNTSSSTNTASSQTRGSSVVTTPQNMLVVMHRVANFSKWKPVYEGHDTARVAAGLHNYVIGRGVQDSNMVLIAMKADDTAKAKAFSKDPGSKQTMQKGGVVGTPTTALITMVYQDTAQLSTTLRVSSMFTVKDWDNWLKNFKDGEQDRKNNGIVVRAYGHEAADNHKVRVVSALLDSAKAMAFYKSDVIKKRMASAGVVGEPTRFFYHVVQRY